MVKPALAPAVVTVPRSVRIGYGVGSVCTATFTTVPGLLLLFYMTNVLAIPAWIAGIVVFLPKLWDIFINPWVGQRSDRTVSRLGARRPWMLLGALTLPVMFALTFAGPPLTGMSAALYVGLFYFLTATAYAFYEVPYKAMATEMTEDYHERSSILQWKMVFVGLAVLLSGALAPGDRGHRCLRLPDDGPGHRGRAAGLDARRLLRYGPRPDGRAGHGRSRRSGPSSPRRAPAGRSWCCSA